MSDIFMIIPCEVFGFDLPDISINLSYSASSVSFSIPSSGKIGSFIDQIAPTVKDGHFKVIGVDAHSLWHEQVVDAVMVERGESIGCIEDVFRHYHYGIVCGIGTSEV